MLNLAMSNSLASTAKQNKEIERENFYTDFSQMQHGLLFRKYKFIKLRN
jgi:hypothetical protein